MASFKVNYAGLRKAQGKNEAPKNFSEPAIASNQPVSSQPAIASRISSKVNSTTSKQDAGFLSPYQGSFHTDNMDYINLLLKNKQSSTKDNKSPTESKKKGHDRNKPSLGDFNQKQPPLQLQSNSPQSNRQLVAVPVNSVEENDKPTSMRPDEDDGFQIIKSKEIKKPVKLIQEPDREEFYEGDDTQRNVVYSPAPFGGRIFERFAKEEGAARRSMSVEDIRLEKKALIMNHNKSTLHDPAELGSYFERSPEKSAHESKHSNMSPKGDFLSNLGGFIDYFHKSENVSYRNMKAGQYLKGNIGKNQRLIQKDLDVAIHELNVRKNQIQELKSTINEILRENKLLKKELKSVHIREQEQHQIFQKMQAEINHLKEKNQHYKSKFMQTKELLGHERSENENNLLSLKQVLANINIALEQRTSPFRNATKEKQSQLKNVLVDSLFLKKNRENLPRQYKKDKGRLNGIIEGYNSIYETGNHRRSIEHKGHKRDSSMLLSQKDSLLSSEEPSDSLSSNQFSNSNKYDNSEEDYQNQGHYQDSYRQSISKNQQIRFLQEKLTELMGNEDITYHSHTPNAKMGIKTSRAKKPYHRRNVSDVGVTNYYMSRERQGSIGKHANPLSKYSPKEQRSRMMHGEYQETPSANVTERSFSVHESQEITE